MTAGTARYRSFPGDGGTPPGVARSHPEPLAAVQAVRDHVAFHNEVADTTVDGELLTRPVTESGKRLLGGG